MHVCLWDHRPFTSNNPIRRNLMALHRTIQGANSDHRNERVHDQEMSRTVIESFHRLCGNCVSAASMSSNFGRKNRVIASRYRAPLTVAARPASFSKKYDPMMPSAQNPRQTVTRCGCVCFSLIARGFSQTRQFCRLTKPSR